MNKKKDQTTEQQTAELPARAEEIPGLNISRTPENIAAEICAIKKQTQAVILQASVEIGRRLTEAKIILPHGMWGTWLEKYVDYSQRTATNLMKLYEEYKDSLNQQSLANLTYTKAVLLLGIAPEERGQFAVENDIENMSTRELQKTIKEKEELEKLLEIAQKVATDKAEEAIKAKADLQRTESELRTSDKVLRDVQGHVKDLQAALQEERKNSKEKAEKLAEAIAETKKQLAEAQSAGNNEEVLRLQESLEKTDNELTKSYEKIEELERQLKEKPIEAAVATVENVPEEVERELAELRGKIVELEAKPDQQTPVAVLKYTVHFEQLVKGFGDILALLEEIGKADQEAYGKYKKALSGLLGKMAERL